MTTQFTALAIGLVFVVWTLTPAERRQIKAFLRTLSGPILIDGRDVRSVSP